LLAYLEQKLEINPEFAWILKQSVVCLEGTIVLYSVF
jgi:hypothetical protein